MRSIEEIKESLITILQSRFMEHPDYQYEEVSVANGTTYFTFLEGKPVKVDHISTKVFPKRIVFDLYHSRVIIEDEESTNYYLLYDSCDDHKVVYYCITSF